MAIKTHKIRCKVTLQSYMEGKAVDVTPFIRSMSVQKNLYQPAGRFEIQLLPGTDQNKVSWYYRTSPMDYIEIRFTRDWQEREIPVVMRGFVDEVGTSVAVDNQGRPQRTIAISGRDPGKIFDITRIYYLKEVSRDLQLIYLPGFKRFEEKYGYQIDGRPSDIIDYLFQVAQNQLSLIRKTQSDVPPIKYLASQSIEGSVNQFALSQEDGSIWDMMNFFDNAPWNELFTADLQDAFYLVFRQTPWKDYDTGEYVQGVDPEVDKLTLGDPVRVEPSSSMRLNLTRGDNEVKNYFFTYPIQNLIDGQTSFKAAVLGAVEKEEDLKSNPYLVTHTDRDAGAYRFGFRRFENTSEFFDINDMAVSRALSEKYNLALLNAFKYNSAYESGSFALKGNSDLRPGIYMTFNYRAGVTPEYYVVGVNHELVFTHTQEQFVTTVNVQRGDGYLRTRDMSHDADLAMKKALK